MASFRKNGRSWFYRFIDENGTQRERKGCPDRRETERMAAAAEAEAHNIRRGFVDPKARSLRDNEARPLTGHLDDFQAHLTDKGTPGRKHPAITRRRVEKVLALASIRKVSELSVSKVQGALAKMRDEGFSIQTINHHVTGLKSFSRWLWREGRGREHRLEHLSTSSPESDRRRRRRTLTPEEAARLVQAAEHGPIVRGMSGPDRARLYALALGTGFRASELASLTPERFDLTASPPTATVQAAFTKNRKEAVQPLPAALADRLAPWLASLPTGQPVFKMPQRRVEMLRFDLDATGLEYETDSGYIDFHSFRGIYISEVVASGASVKVCQTLARHASPSLTIGLYAKASLHDINGAIDSLPDPGKPSPRPEALAATGTTGKRSSNRPSLHFPYVGDASCQNLSGAVGYASGTPEAQTVALSGVDALCRVPSKEAPGGFEPPMEVLQTSALPLGYGAII